MLGAAVLLASAGGAAAQLFRETITLAGVVPDTGTFADIGRAYRQAYTFAVDTINGQGGVAVGGRTYPLRLTLRDSKSDPKQSVPLYEKLLTDAKATFAIGPYTSIEALAASEVAQKLQVPMLTAGGASRLVFSRGNGYVFGTQPPAEEYFESTIAMLNELTPRMKTVAIVSGNGEFDRAVTEATVRRLKREGFDVIDNLEYSERSPNFTNILTLLKDRAPDALLWSGHETNAIAFIRRAKNHRFAPNLLSAYAAGVPSAQFRAAVGDLANYAFGMTPWLPGERHKDRWFGDASQFAAAFEKKFGYPPHYYMAAAVAAVEALVLAIEAAGSLDRNAVRDALAALDFDSVYGRVRFGENGQIAIPQTVVQIQDGKLVEIFAGRFINRPVYPAPPQ